jgi:CHAT domain-containing protein/tetratricopeptide (TPR) repeat protein
MEAGDYPTARRLFSTTLLGKDFYFNAYWRLAQCYAFENNFDQGQIFFENLLSRNAPAGEVYSALAFLAEMKGDRQRLADYCWKAVQNRTAFLSIHQKLIDLAPAFGLEQNVREHLTERLAKNPADWPAQYALAYWETLRGRPETAVAQFAKLSAAGLKSWRVYFRWSVQLMLLSKLDSARIVIDRGLAATSEINDQDGEGQLLHLKGHLYMRQGRLNVADSILIRAEQLSREVGYVDLQADLAATLSGLRLRQGRLQQALIQAKRAEALSTKLRSDYGRMQAHHYAGDAYHLMGLYEKAITERTRAYQLADSLKNESNRQLMAHNLAVMYQVVGDHYRALAYFEEAITFARKYRQTLYLASYLQVLATSLVELGRFDEAKSHYEEALGIAKKNALKELECDIVSSLATLWQKLDNWKMAANAATEALALARRAQLKTRTIDALIKLGDAELHNRQLSKAEKHFYEAQRLSAEAGLYASLIASMHGLGRIAFDQGNNEKAVSILGEAAALVSRRVFSGQAAATSALLPVEKKLFFALSRAYIHLQQPLKALEIAEQMRDLVVRRRLQRAGLMAQAGLADSLRLQGAQLDTLLLQKRLQLANRLAADSAGNEKMKLRLELAELELRQQRFLEKIGITNRDSNHHPILPLAALQQELAKRQELAFVYLVGNEGVLIFALDGNSVFADETPVTKSALQNLVSQVNPALHYAFQDSQGMPLISPLLFRYKPQAAAGLYQMLLARFIDHANGKKLLIIPDEHLHFLPFEILLKKANRDSVVKDYRQMSFVLKNHTVRYASSLQAAFEEQPARPPKTAVVFALAQSLPQFDGTLNGSADLWETQNEVKAIQKILGDAAVKTMYGPFSAQMNWRNDLRRYPILHFAAHSEAQNTDPLSSRIILEERDAGSTHLYAFEIFAMHLPNGRLAFLSSCNTASGILHGSEGLQGFVQAFRAAGIPSVIGSLWPADAEASARLAGEFYHYLSFGKTAAEALRRAKLSLLESNKPTPFFWAAFQYYGADQSFRFRQSLNLAPAGALIFAALIISVTRKVLRHSSRKN